MTAPDPARIVRIGWGITLAVLCVYALRTIGAFDLQVTLADGRVVPNTFATVDHPFHASRAASLLESLRQGDILRWMGSHQGGYPVEFYPLGVAWLDIVAWAALFGQVSILAVHKLIVGLIFVLPALGYWLLVRGDRIHPAAAFLAMSIHIAVPGYWLNGGYEELVGWGLVTNVAGASFALISTMLLARYVLYRQHACGVAAVCSIAAGAVSNPRSLFGVAIAAIAIVVWQVLTGPARGWKARVIDAVVPVAVVAGLSFLVAAPVIVPLMRYNDQYFFLHYQFYEPLDAFWDALQMALTRRVLLLSIAAGILVLMLYRLRAIRVSQVLALVAAAYSSLTLWVASTDNPPPLVEQLEAPRLMPFQRLVMIALAAAGAVLVLQWLVAQLPLLWREAIIAILVLGVCIVGIQRATDPLRDVAANEIAMYPVATVGDQLFADLEDAVVAANDVRPQGSAIFVIGNQQDWWHEQLWAPGIEQGTYYYDDWLWYWHADQSGPYDPTHGYYMDNPSDALTAAYFAQHGIGVVLVSDMWVPSGTAPRATAAESDLLSHVGTWGSWDVYTVNQPGTMVTRGDTAPTTISVANERIEATFADGSGGIVIRHNWFPRWQATVNGESVPIERTDDGYMRIAVPDGPIDLNLVYEVTALDWTARGASVLGVAGTILFALTGRKVRPDGPEEISRGAAVAG